MIKPNDFNDVQAYRGFTPIAPGGHICRIIKVEETQSKAKRSMIKIFIDTDRLDKQPSFYKEKYDNDKRENKTWGCIVYQLVFDADGNTNRGFKTFIDAVEKSNDGFSVQWGDNFVECFKGKLIGGVFGREEYLNNFGESKFATKCSSFRTVEDIKNGVEPPKDKLLISANDGLIAEDFGNMPF